MFNLLEEASHHLNNELWPHARSGHRICIVSNYMYLFGGYHPNTAIHTLYNELWRYNITTHYWTKLPDREKLCPKMCASSSMLIWRNKIFVFGGTAHPFGRWNSDKLFMYCLDEYRWKDLNTFILQKNHETTIKECGCMSINFSRPDPKYGQSMALTRQSKLVIFSGTDGLNFYDDLHEFDLITYMWTKFELCDNHKRHNPESRYRHEAIVWNNKYFVFGGMNQEGTYNYNFQKIPYLDLDDYSWNSIKTSVEGGVDHPSWRKAHSCVFHDDRVFMIGGINESGALNDFWIFDLKKLQWTLHYTWFPCRLYFHAAAITQQGCMFVYGGVEENSIRSSRLHKIWLQIPSLAEQCWRIIIQLLKVNDKLQQQSLVELGIPKRFILRLDD